MLYSNLNPLRLIALFIVLVAYTVAGFGANDSVQQIADQSRRQSQAVLNQLFQTEKKVSLSDEDNPSIPDSGSSLYYFLSFSMPPQLIQSYFNDALKDGGTIVFRGVRKDQNLQQFLSQSVFPLIKDKGQRAPIELDPNKFETYQVDVVPTIVLVNDELDDANDERVRYWKLSGSVSSHYALEQFLEKQGPAERFLLGLGSQYQSE